MPKKFKAKQPKPRKEYTLEQRVGIKRRAEEEATRVKGEKVGRSYDPLAGPEHAIWANLAQEAESINPATLPETLPELPEWTGHDGTTMDEAWGQYAGEMPKPRKAPPPQYEPAQYKEGRREKGVGEMPKPKKAPPQFQPEKYPGKKFELKPKKARQQDPGWEGPPAHYTGPGEETLERPRASRRDIMSRTHMTDEGIKVKPLAEGKSIDSDFVKAVEQRNMNQETISHIQDDWGGDQRAYLARSELEGVFFAGKDDSGRTIGPGPSSYLNEPYAERGEKPKWAKDVGFNPEHTESYRDEIRRKTSEHKEEWWGRGKKGKWEENRGGPLFATIHGQYSKNIGDYHPLPDMDMSGMMIDPEKLNVPGRRKPKSHQQVLREEREYRENYQEPIKVKKPPRTQTHSGIPLEAGGSAEYPLDDPGPPAGWTPDEDFGHSTSTRIQELDLEPEPEPSFELVPWGGDEISDAMDELAITSNPEGIPWEAVVAEDARQRRVEKLEEQGVHSIGAGGAKMGRKVKALLREMRGATEVEKVQLQQRINEIQGHGWGKHWETTTRGMEEKLASEAPAVWQGRGGLKVKYETAESQIVSQEPMSEGMLETHRYNQGGGITGAPREPIKREETPSWAGRFNPTKKHTEWTPGETEEPVGEAEEQLQENYEEFISDTEDEDEEVEDVEPEPEPTGAPLDTSWAEAVESRPVRRTERTIADFAVAEGFEGPTPLYEDPMRELTPGEIMAGKSWAEYAREQNIGQMAEVSGGPWKGETRSEYDSGNLMVQDRPEPVQHPEPHHPRQVAGTYHAPLTNPDAVAHHNIIQGERDAGRLQRPRTPPQQPSGWDDEMISTWSPYPIPGVSSRVQKK